MHGYRIKEGNNDIKFFYSISYNTCKFIASHQQQGKELSIQSKKIAISCSHTEGQPFSHV